MLLIAFKVVNLLPIFLFWIFRPLVLGTFFMRPAFELRHSPFDTAMSTTNGLMKKQNSEKVSS